MLFLVDDEAVEGDAGAAEAGHDRQGEHVAGASMHKPPGDAAHSLNACACTKFRGGELLVVNAGTALQAALPCLFQLHAHNAGFFAVEISLVIWLLQAA